jgi:acyl-CoA reductase-like NAD-dependent aldehyde dehydrogenase
VQVLESYVWLLVVLLCAAFAYAWVLQPEVFALASKLRVGDPSLPETEVGPLIRHKEVLRVDQWVGEALDGGAQLLCGGRALSESCYAAYRAARPAR